MVNIKMQIGGFLESRLAFTASAHLALCSDNFVHFDFDSPLMLAEDFVLGGLSYNEVGEVSVSEEVGLGAIVNEEYLKGLVKWRISL